MKKFEDLEILNLMVIRKLFEINKKRYVDYYYKIYLYI